MPLNAARKHDVVAVESNAAVMVVDVLTDVRLGVAAMAVAVPDGGYFDCCPAHHSSHWCCCYCWCLGEAAAAAGKYCWLRWDPFLGEGEAKEALMNLQSANCI